MARIDNIAPIGSLLKHPRAARKPARSPRVRDEGYLALIRKLPCLSCGMVPSEAAHVRQASSMHGKPVTGMGTKPDDRWTLPLCQEHHAEQHREGELSFWYRLNISPCILADELFRASPDIERMRAVVFSSSSGT